jgi:hypothetical protein
MKKILFAVVLLTFTSSIFSQTLNFGIKAGINSQKITTDSYKGIGGYTFSDFKSDTKLGYNVGVFARLGANKLYLQPEVLYSIKKGSASQNLAESSGSLDAGVYTQTFDVKSIQVPLLLGYKLIDLKLASVRLFTGPAMSVILRNSQISLTGSGGVAVDPSLYDPKTFKNNVWNWQLGGGVDVGPLVLDVRYEWGLTNVSDGDVTKIGFVNKGNILTFSLGYKLL